MRWNNLFDDLEGQLEQELGAEEIDLRSEEERLRIGRMTIRDRLLALQHSVAPAVIRVSLGTPGPTVRLEPTAFGRDWFSADLLDETPRRRQVIVPLAAVSAVELEAVHVPASLAATTPADPPRGLSHRLGLAFALRDLCRRRAALELTLLGGTVHGTIDRVGRDHLDLAVHEPGAARRDPDVLAYRVIPFAQLLLVRM
jgi:hypothetical protein